MSVLKKDYQVENLLKNEQTRIINIIKDEIKKCKNDDTLGYIKEKLLSRVLKRILK